MTRADPTCKPTKTFKFVLPECVIHEGLVWECEELLEARVSNGGDIV